MKEGSEPPSSNVFFLLGRIRAPQTPPGCGHCCGVRAVAPPGWTQHSPVHPCHFPTHPGPHLQGRHLPLCCCRAGGGDSRVPYPPGGPWLCSQLRVGLQKQQKTPGLLPPCPSGTVLAVRVGSQQTQRGRGCWCCWNRAWKGGTERIWSGPASPGQIPARKHQPGLVSPHLWGDPEVRGGEIRWIRSWDSLFSFHSPPWEIPEPGKGDRSQLWASTTPIFGDSSLEKGKHREKGTPPELSLPRGPPRAGGLSKPKV